jgi:hypothetical protein
MTDKSKGKKLCVLLGSPRKNGNSETLAVHIGRAAETAGAGVEYLFVHGMDIKPCRACWSCQNQNSKGCAIIDDMQGVYTKLVEADAWVIATPVHWFNMSTQTKLWMDRASLSRGTARILLEKRSESRSPTAIPTPLPRARSTPYAASRMPFDTSAQKLKALSMEAPSNRGDRKKRRGIEGCRCAWTEARSIASIFIRRICTLRRAGAALSDISRKCAII